MQHPQLNELMKKGKNLSAGEQKTKEKLMTKYHTNILTRQVRLLTAGLSNQKKDLNEFNSDRQEEKKITRNRDRSAKRSFAR